MEQLVVVYSRISKYSSLRFQSFNTRRRSWLNTVTTVFHWKELVRRLPIHALDPANRPQPPTFLPYRGPNHAIS